MPGNAQSYQEVLRICRSLLDDEQRQALVEALVALEAYLADIPLVNHIHSDIVAKKIVQECPTFALACEPWAVQVFGHVMKKRMLAEGATFRRVKRPGHTYPHHRYRRLRAEVLNPLEFAREIESLQ